MHKLFLIFLASVVLAFFSISLFDIYAVFSVVLSSNIYLVIVAIFLQIFLLFLYAIRFKIVASKYKKIGFRDAFYISIVGNFVSLITPIAKIGGQPIMIYLTKGKIGGAKASAVVVMDSLIDIAISVFFVVFIVLLFHGIMPYQIFFPLIVFTAICIIIMLFFIKVFLSAHILSRFLDSINKRVKRMKRARKIFHADMFESSFRGFFSDKKRMSSAFLISIIVKFLEFLRMWIIFKAIGVSLSYEIILIVWAFMLLLLMIPWLPGSLGLFEFGSSSAFILLGITSVQAAGGVMLDRFVSFWFVILFSIAVIVLSRHRLGEIIEMAEKGKN